MKDCNLCDGTGIRQTFTTISDAAAKRWHESPTRMHMELCQCVVAELGALRVALVHNGLLPPEHWQRMQPPRAAASVPPELNYLVLSVRRDGYRITSQRLENHGSILHALGPDGAGIFDGNGARLWWDTVEDAERSIDRNFPLPQENPADD